MAQKNDIFYVYDSIAGTQAKNWKEHRWLLANMAKRSRFLIVNPGVLMIQKEATRARSETDISKERPQGQF